MAHPAAAEAAVSPRGAGRGEGGRARGARLAAAAAALLAFAAAVAAVTRGGAPAVSSLGQERAAAGSSAAEKARLAFGDGAFQPSGATSREGSVRGQRPDFKPPIGSLGSTGLKHAASAEQLSLAAASAHPQLAFGDAEGFKASRNPEAKEGGVRNGVKPDYHPPVGDLGKVGLAKEGAPQPGAQALAFGDASFHASEDTGKREGSVRGGKRPDFKPPMGSLGATGLAQKKGAPMSTIAAREEADKYFDEQAEAIKRLASKARPPLVTSVVAHSQLSNFFDKLQGEARGEHARVISRQVAHERSSAGDMASYFSGIDSKDRAMHQAALQREHDEDAAMRRLEDSEAAHAAAQRKEAKAAPAKAANAAQAAAHAGEEAAHAAQQAAQSKLRGTTEALANAEGGIFDAPAGNKHGFHAPHVARAAGVRQELKAARDIAKNDLDDCAFTLC